MVAVALYGLAHTITKIPSKINMHASCSTPIIKLHNTMQSLYILFHRIMSPTRFNNKDFSKNLFPYLVYPANDTSPRSAKTQMISRKAKSAFYIGCECT